MGDKQFGFSVSSRNNAKPITRMLNKRAYFTTFAADPALVDLAISRGAFTMPGLQFNSSLRDLDSFQRHTYGGYLMRQGLSQSVLTRIVANRTMEQQLLFDISHPDAFNVPEDISYGGHFDITVAGNPDEISSVVMLRTITTRIA